MTALRSPLAALALSTAALLLAAPALAQEATAPSAGGGSEAMAFEAADEAQTENIAGAPLMLGAYAVAWLLLFGYLASLGFRLAATAREMERLREDVAAAVGGAPDSRAGGGAPREEQR